MTNKILKKCLDELNKDGEADLSYIKGMIETLLALGESDAPAEKTKSNLLPTNIVMPAVPETPSMVDEAMTAAEKTVAALQSGMTSKMTIVETEEIEVNRVQ